MRQMNMLHGSLWDKILLFSLPLAGSSILQQLFNSADVAVVGRFAGSQALAAVGSNSSVISLMVNLFVGLSVGANVVIARLIGRHEPEKVREAVHTVVMLALISGGFMLIVGQLAAKPLLVFMDTPDDVVELAVLYLRIYFLGMPFIMIYNFGAAILRSKGDTKRPLYCLILSGVINVCLNLLLVIVFKLSVAGVGIATVASNGISAGMILYFLTHEEDMIRVDFGRLALKKSCLMSVLKIGLPAGLQGIVFSISNVCIQTAVNGFGADAIAGASAALNFEYFSYYVSNAFGQAAVTFTSQNYGAGQWERCKKTLWLSMVFGFVLCEVMSLLFVGAGRFFIGFYTTEEGVIHFALIRMVHALAFNGLTAVYETGGGFLRGLGHSMLPAFLTMLGCCGFRLVWVYTVFVHIHSFEMLMNVYPASWMITDIFVLAACCVISRPKRKDLT